MIFQNDNDDKKDYELSLLNKKAISILRDNNPIFLKYDVNYFYESYKRIYNLYFKLNEFIISEGIKNTNNLDIIHSDNINNSFLNEYSLSYDNYNYNEMIFPVNFYNNSSIINNNYKRYYNYFKSLYSKIGSEASFSLEIKRLNNYKKKKNSNICKKKNNKFKVISKISRYRGVTKNKKKWQVYIYINKKNKYLGSYNCEKTAAKIYDFMAIKKNGMRAKTNFTYNFKQIIKIYRMHIDINNIFEIVSKGNI